MMCSTVICFEVMWFIVGVTLDVQVRFVTAIPEQLYNSFIFYIGISSIFLVVFFKHISDCFLLQVSVVFANDYNIV